MCGRFVQVSSPDLLVERFGVDEVATPRHEPSYNVAPRATVYAVRDRVVEDTRRRYLSELRWGLVPSWAKDPRSGDRMINARAESLADKPAYQRAFQKHRCLLPADGFYEWQPRGRRKQPMFIHRRDGEPMAFAGLWAAWRDANDPDSEWLRTCAIVTTNANDTLAPLHDRMPVVLEARDWQRWLDPAVEDDDALGSMLVPAADDLLVAYPVGTAVNSADNDGPELVERVELEATLGL
ncbi:MAG TPA: SOS response-associated peptidase [Acidimicrobiia bacterium]|nr:SOS response-associated peptidase [Acidimicrobiia bacterium]